MCCKCSKMWHMRPPARVLRITFSYWWIRLAQRTCIHVKKRLPGNARVQTHAQWMRLLSCVYTDGINRWGGRLLSRNLRVFRWSVSIVAVRWPWTPSPLIALNRFLNEITIFLKERMYTLLRNSCFLREILDFSIFFDVQVKHESFSFSFQWTCTALNVWIF